MERLKEIERTIIKNYRAKLWAPFVKALKEYGLFKENDTINVIIDGTNGSFLLAKLFEELKKHSDFEFELNYLAYDLEEIKANLEILNLKATIIPLDYKFDDNLIYALSNNYDDVIETTLKNILFNGIYETRLPKEKKIIRPLYLIKYKDIKNWEKKNELTFIKKILPKDQMRIKEIIKELYDYNELVEKNIFRSAENVNADKILGFIKDGKNESFLDDYENKINLGE
jgi:hypothetical protein